MIRVREPSILVVEDNLADIELFQFLIQKNGTSLILSFAHDGVEAFETLEKLENFPTLILLDLNLPKMSGIELLKKVKEHPKYRKIPVIILSTSNNPLEVQECYHLGANAFVSKPHNLAEYQRIVDTMLAFWLTCTLPMELS